MSPKTFNLKYVYVVQIIRKFYTLVFVTRKKEKEIYRAMMVKSWVQISYGDERYHYGFMMMVKEAPI